MIEEKYIELIQADVDGELPDVRRAELAAYLLANPEARALRDELRSVSDALRRLPSVPPPPGLADSVLAAFPEPVGELKAAGRARPWLQSGLLRYAAVFIGGMLAAAIALQAGLDRRNGMDVSEIAGTMVAGDPVARTPPVDSVNVSLEQVTGTVSLYASASMRIVEFDLAVRQPVEVVIIHDGQQASFGSAASSDAGGRYALVLDGPGRPGEPIELDFVAGGSTVHREELRVPGPGT